VCGISIVVVLIFDAAIVDVAVVLMQMRWMHSRMIQPDMRVRMVVVVVHCG